MRPSRARRIFLCLLYTSVFFILNREAEKLVDPIKILKAPAGDIDQDVRTVGRVIDDRDELLLIGFVPQVLSLIHI